MKLVSGKIQDYYDSCLAHHDTSGNVFIRKPQEIIIYTQPKSAYIKNESFRTPKINPQLAFLVQDFKRSIHERTNQKRKKFIFVFMKILVAGKIYGSVRIRWSRYENPKTQAELDDTYEVYLYSYSSVQEFCEEHKINLFDPDNYLFSTIKKIKNSERLWKEHFNIIEKYLSECIEHKLVIGIITPQSRYETGYNVTLNGSLKDIQFYKVLDAYSIFQELQMYIDGCLTYPGNEMYEIEDKFKIEGHGFDKRSFRKDPTKIRK